MSELSKILNKEFKDKESAHAYVDEFLNTSIATQIKVLREQRGWTQRELASKTGMEQSRISLLENINYDKWSIYTLKKFAETFDVTLNVSFETFSDRIRNIDDFSRESLERLSRENDLALEEYKESNNRAFSGKLELVVYNPDAAISETEIKNRIPITDSGKKEVEETIQVAARS